MVAHTKTTIGAYEARTKFAQLLRRVEAGEEITITRNGHDVVRMLPAKRTFTPEERRAAWARLVEATKHTTLGGLKIKDLINEGRR